MCMSIKDFMSPEQLEKYNSSDFTPKPSLGGVECKGNGKHEDTEIQCDECDYFLECFPEYQTEEVTADDPEKIYAISGSGMSFMSKSEILRTTK